MHIPPPTNDSASLDFACTSSRLAQLRKVVDDRKPSHETSMHEIADGTKSDPETDDGEGGICEI